MILDNPSSVPAPPGQFSHVARVETGNGALLFFAGQVALDDEGRIVGDTMGEQCERILEIFAGLLAAHGATFDDVVNIRTYVTDMDTLGELRAVRAKYFRDPAPTSTTVEVSRLFRDEALLEVEMVAVARS